MTPDEQLTERANAACSFRERCANCSHDFHDGTCEYEPGDRWQTGSQSGEPTVLVAMPPCGCDHYEPETFEDILERENSETI